MKARTLFALAGPALLVTGLNAQTFRQQAAIVGGGGDTGRCTVEMVVDGAAQIAIRGTDATITNLNGGVPQLRRFECNSPLPSNPVEFRFRGINGRGRQDLIGTPGQGQPAVVRIEDPQGGSDRYLFEIAWRNGGVITDRGPFGGRDRRFTADQAVNVCKDAARQQTSERYRTGDVNFRDTRIDDQPGRNDWVVGTLEARHPGRQDEILKFSCSVNFDTGQVRSVQVDPVYAEGRGNFGGPGGRRFTTEQAVNVCKDSARRQTQEQYRTGDVNFRDTRIDDQPGRNDWVVGTLEARHPGRPDEILKFSCSVNFDTGAVRSVQVDPVYAEGGQRGGLNPGAVRNCRQSVQDRVSRDGYGQASFGNITVDDRPGRTDWLMGDFQASGRYGAESLHFSCAVDARNGDVKSVDITTRR